MYLCVSCSRKMRFAAALSADALRRKGLNCRSALQQGDGNRFHQVAVGFGEPWGKDDGEVFRDVRRLQINMLFVMAAHRAAILPARANIASVISRLVLADEAMARRRSKATATELNSKYGQPLIDGSQEGSRSARSISLGFEKVCPIRCCATVGSGRKILPAKMTTA